MENWVCALPSEVPPHCGLEVPALMKRSCSSALVPISCHEQAQRAQQAQHSTTQCRGSAAHEIIYIACHTCSFRRTCPLRQ